MRPSNLQINLSCTSGITSLIDRNVAWVDYKFIGVDFNAEVEGWESGTHSSPVALGLIKKPSPGCLVYLLPRSATRRPTNAKIRRTNAVSHPPTLNTDGTYKASTIPAPINDAARIPNCHIP
jgi:hypothetical protein